MARSNFNSRPRMRANTSGSRAWCRERPFQLPPSHEGEPVSPVIARSHILFQLPPSHEGELGTDGVGIYRDGISTPALA